MQRHAARIIDANANRAREALRVLEDAARFLLDDAPLSAAIKGLRHDLRAALDSLPLTAADLLAARDTPGDVGAAITTASEARRGSIADVAAAAAKRLTEALRSLEEAAKTLPGEGHAAFERLRYRAYDSERSLLLALAPPTAPQWRLCVILTESLCAGPWLDVAAAALDAGADCLQLREKTLESRDLLSRARALVALARGRAAVIVNDRPDIAALAGAAGVHVGRADLAVEDVRRLAGFSLLIGVSTATIDEARAAHRAGASYCGVGAMFPTPTKPKASISGPAYLREYLAHQPALPPHLAIGGVNEATVREIAAAGARGVAVSSAVCAAPDPAAAVRALLAALTPRPTTTSASG